MGLIFRGRVVWRHTILGRAPGPPAGESLAESYQGFAVAHFQVLETLRGDAGKYVDVIEGADPDFLVGKEYLVYAMTEGEGDWSKAYSCKPSHGLARGAQDADLQWLRTAPGSEDTGEIDGSARSYLPAFRVVGAVVLTGPVSSTVVLDSEGKYRFVNLLPGTYGVSAALPAWETPGSPTYEVEVEAGHCATADVQVQRADSIDGRVTLGKSQRLAPEGIRMALVRPDPEQRTGYSSVAYSSTDRAGDFRFGALTPGDYWLIANDDGPTEKQPFPPTFYGDGPTPKQARSLHVTDMTAMRGITIRLADEAVPVKVKLDVRQADGSVPKGKVRVDVVDAITGHWTVWGVAADHGEFEAALFAGREYFLKVGSSVDASCANPLRFTAKEGLELSVVLSDTWDHCEEQYKRMKP